LGDWAGFFQAELGAAAALAGLVIVAISINVSRILSEPTLPGRAAETLVSPSGVLIACSFALVPHQPAWVLGLEFGATGIAMAAAPAIILVPLLRAAPQVHWGYIFGRTLLAGLSCLPFLVCGVLLWLGDPRALYWLVPGVIVSLIATVLNAWVLLVEILR
jgi:modulator of FtsH protease